MFEQLLRAIHNELLHPLSDQWLITFDHSDCKLLIQLGSAVLMVDAFAFVNLKIFLIVLHFDHAEFLVNLAFRYLNIVVRNALADIRDIL